MLPPHPRAPGLAAPAPARRALDLPWRCDEDQAQPRFHPGVIDYKGKTYLFYHDGSLPGGGSFSRSVCVEELKFDADGAVIPVDMTRAARHQWPTSATRALRRDHGPSGCQNPRSSPVALPSPM